MGYKLTNFSDLSLSLSGKLDGSLCSISIVDGYFTFKFNISLYGNETYEDIKLQFAKLDIEINRLVELKKKNLLS